MDKKIIIAVDAMGGENAPKKVIDGIAHHYKKNKNSFYKIFGFKKEIEKFIPSSLDKNSFEIIETDNKVEDTDSPLSAAKKVKIQVCGLLLKV